MIQEHVREKELEDVDKVLETNPANTAINTAKHEPLGAIAKLETPDDDYKETGARNRMFEKTDQNAFDEKLLEQNNVSNLSLKTVLRKMKPRNLQMKHLIRMP